MKKFTIIFATLITMTINANSQIPNNGFESLNGWVTGNATLSTDHYPESVGNYSVKLENQMPLTNNLSYGYAVTGIVNNGCVPSFPITGHPTKLCGYYKCFPVNVDTIQIGIELFKNGVWIAGGQLITTDTVSDWTSFNIPIFSYTESYTNIDADSATITVAAFYNDTTCGFPYGPFGNSVLYVDNLSFDNLITSGVNSISNIKEINISPNPTTDAFHIAGIEGTAILSLSDINGRLLFTKEVTTDETISVSFLQNGLYLATITSKGFTKTENLIIKR